MSPGQARTCPAWGRCSAVATRMKGWYMGELISLPLVRRGDFTEVAAGLLRLLDALPAEDDTPRDAAIRRRLEGALIAAELAAGRDPLHDTDV